VSQRQRARVLQQIFFHGSQHAVKHRWINAYYFTKTLKHICNTGSESFMSYFSRLGANVPGSESSRERKFQGTKVPGSESTREQKFQGAKVPCNFRSRERKFQRAKVPGNESSTYGTFALGSESTWERKFHNSVGISFTFTWPVTSKLLHSLGVLYIHRTTEHYTHILVMRPLWSYPTTSHRPTYCECESTYVLDSLTRVGIRSISSLLFP